MYTSERFCYRVAERDSFADRRLPPPPPPPPPPRPPYFLKPLKMEAIVKGNNLLLFFLPHWGNSSDPQDMLLCKNNNFLNNCHLSYMMLTFASFWAITMTDNLMIFLCPRLRRSWRGILLLGCLSVRPSIHPSICYAFFFFA